MDSNKNTLDSESKCSQYVESPIIALSKHLLHSNGSIRGQEIEDIITPKYKTFASAIPTDLREQPVLASIDGRSSLSHKQAHNFIVHEFGPKLHQLGFGRGDRVALVLPNGPELALAIVSTLNWATCVPLSAQGAESELEADLARCGANLVIGPFLGSTVGKDGSKTQIKEDRYYVEGNDAGDWSGLKHVKATAQRLNMPYVGLAPSPTDAGVFKLVMDDSKSFDFSEIVELKRLRGTAFDDGPTEKNDQGLVLFTSGTTGNKKCVPHQMGDMLTAAVTISLSWALTPDDVNCNLMPLFHVGGIVRQVFSPLISGGCVICCSSFDAHVFWSLMAKKAFTWYYTAPTMHERILLTYDEDDHGCNDPKLRMIANAAGGLPHSLAVKLQTLFKSHTLPSYGSTEAMPISSPPATYELEKPGCSGIPVGPEVSIQNPDTGEEYPTGKEGAICVRGPPIFRGYAPLANDPDQKVPDAFNKEGWFNTGDNGYVDTDGYLYVTGRSKEVINRGGEIISPLEIDGAVLDYPDINTCTAFSAPHKSLQECVGIVIVMKKDRPRVDLHTLNDFLSKKLEPAKWPQCIVYMDDLPKSLTNKVLRIKLGQRLKLPDLHDNMTAIERSFEAKCPPKGTSMNEPIESKVIEVSIESVQSNLSEVLGLKAGEELLVKYHPKHRGALICYSAVEDRKEALEKLQSKLDLYTIPRHFVFVEGQMNDSDLPEPSKEDSIVYILRGGDTSFSNPVVEHVQQLFADMLGLDYVPEPWDSFFQIGGSSMLASQLANKVRTTFDISCSGSEIFRNSTSEELGEMVSQRIHRNNLLKNSSIDTESASESESEKSVTNHGAPFDALFLKSENSVFKMMFELIPLLVIFPIWQISRYLLFFRLLLWTMSDLQVTDIGAFILTYVLFYIGWMTVMPLVFVLIKWVIIGKYKEGRYPIWSWYYLRWWFVDVSRKLLLRGFFASNSSLLRFYYRLLGANIAKGAVIDPRCEMAEFDLVTVGQNAAIAQSHIRAFGLSNGAMILGPVSVGNNASVGVKSVVAPYTCVPDDVQLGPSTTSYDITQSPVYEARSVNPSYFHQPNGFMKVFIVFPLCFLISAFSKVPPFLVLFFLVRYKGHVTFSNVGDVMEWLTDPGRIPYFIGIRLARAIISPFFYMFASILTKRLIIGRFKAGPRSKSQWQLTRHYLASIIFSKKKVQEVTDLVGRHYELVSWIYRCLGAQVGKRVFWPGNQPCTSGEFDLLEIGDDVVFGSRSTILFSTSETCEDVVFSAGSNIADNCVVLPGAVLGKNAVLASNTLCPRGRFLPEGSVWFGCKGGEPCCLKSGAEDMTQGPPKSKLELACDVQSEIIEFKGDESTLRPFGNAFYKRNADYFVLPLPIIFFLTHLVKIVVTSLHTLPLLASLYGATEILYGVGQGNPNFSTLQYSYAVVFFAVLVAFILAHAVRCILIILVELVAKWIIIGHRKEGEYNYDRSSYAQRWEIYLMLGKILRFNRLNVIDFLAGTPYMTAFFRAKGASIGKGVCLYPTGADPYMPEPDLVTIGDYSAIDRAAIVDHLNTKGKFCLKPIKIGKHCTMRSLSRVQQGVVMEDGSMLLEKALAMTGEVVDTQSVWQGIPAHFWFSQNMTNKTDIV